MEVVAVTPTTFALSNTVEAKFRSRKTAVNSVSNGLVAIFLFKDATAATAINVGLLPAVVLTGDASRFHPRIVEATVRLSDTTPRMTRSSLVSPVPRLRTTRPRFGIAPRTRV
jgi:hypothetical protein